MTLIFKGRWLSCDVWNACGGSGCDRKTFRDLVDIHGHAWPPWTATDSHEYSWKSMVTHGYPWISGGIRAFPSISMYTHGFHNAYAWICIYSLGYIIDEGIIVDSHGAFGDTFGSLRGDFGVTLE